MCSGCYLSKTPKVKKNDINVICELKGREFIKGREFNSRSLGYFALFCLGNGRAEKIAF
jgi:hypothetical protein